MTVQQLIAALQAMPPGKPVRVLMGIVTIDMEPEGDVDFELDEELARPAQDVLDRGAFVLLRG